jgi:hypothetical protein
MLGGHVRSIVSLGLEPLLVLFDKQRVPSHLFLQRVRMQLGSGQQVATAAHLLLVRAAFFVAIARLLTEVSATVFATEPRSLLADEAIAAGISVIVTVAVIVCI